MAKRKKTDEVLLFVPDDENVMERGACNSKPPHVVAGRQCAYAHHRRWNEELPHENCYMCSYPDEAIAIIWKGELLPLGLTFLAHLAGEPIDHDEDAFAEAYRIADLAERACLGEVVKSREN